MIAADIDASLCTGEPVLEKLDDGFSPPTVEPVPETPGNGALPPEAQLGTKSPF
jgi:hypothetical protein